MIDPQNDDAALMRSILQRIATGPELSKNISREEARAGMRLVLEQRVDPVQAGVFLIALRMKRETDDEMLGILDALREATPPVAVPVDQLVDVGDPYDGYARSLPVAAFLPAVLAACGVPAVSHGVETMGPKYGATHRQVLRACGVPVDLTPDRAAARLANPAIGWAYVDQSVFCPSLHRLAALRSLIVKRPALTTVEVLIGPLRARGATHALTGYVHKAYPRIYALLARAAGFRSALLVRGLEGGVIPSLRQAGKCFYYKDGGAEQLREFRPEDFGFAEPLRPPEPAAAAAPEIARAAAAQGQAALRGKPGTARDNLVAAAALCLHHLDRHASLKEAADAVRRALDDGSAWARFSSAVAAG